MHLEQILEDHSCKIFFSSTIFVNTRWICPHGQPTTSAYVYTGICLPTYLLGSPILAGIHDENAYPRRTWLRGRLGSATVRSDTRLPVVVKVCPGEVIPTRSDTDDRWQKMKKKKNAESRTTIPKTSLAKSSVFGRLLRHYKSHLNIRHNAYLVKQIRMNNIVSCYYANGRKSQ